MRHRLLFPTALILAPALLLGGCMGTQNRGLESVHQPVIARQDFLLDLRTAGDRLARGEATRLSGWLTTMHLRFGDTIGIDDPVGYGGVRDDVERTIASYGLLLGEDRPVTGAPMTPGTIRVVVSRMTATVPGCPDYSRNSSVEYDSNTSSNFGCATNSNLAAMVARPEDLLHGQGSEGTDPARSGKAIEAYRKAVPTGGGGNTVGGGGVK